jgi:Zn finger protein HypA/HybF involved in hydrogenase expression
MGKRLTQQEIINEFKKVHGDKYDYSLVNYINDSSKVKIICFEHGEYDQQVAAHKRHKQGCPKCGNIKMGKSQQVGNEKFIQRIEKIYGIDAFDYSKLDYKGAHKDITLICKKCNSIETKDAKSFYMGFGCLKCKGSIVGKKLLTTDDFIKRAKKIHGFKYDYSNVIYTGISSKVEIICPKHGSFFQQPNVHINMKCNCPECNITKGEEAISIWLNNKKTEYIFQHKVKINNSYHYYDFYLPNYNIMIEYNGLQHYKPISFFGGKKGFDYLQSRDEIKKQYCINNNIKLIIISYKDNIEELLNKTLNS